MQHSLCDDELFRQFAEGDDRAFTTLYERYRERLIGYVHSLLGSDNPASDDVFQESFLRLFRERERCRSGATQNILNVGGWLFRVARNLSLNQIRSARYLTALPPEYNELMFVTVEEAHAGVFDEGPSEHALMEAIGVVIETLPSGLREVFVLREMNGLSYSETATIIGCSEEAARMRLSRARSAIRRALQSMFVDH
ncbi:MAG: RNA polymerase sigma factor [bacterium]|nr:RNA polymerase sigma factor [Candidatus Kapabacteria bacterium]